METFKTLLERHVQKTWQRNSIFCIKMFLFYNTKKLLFNFSKEELLYIINSKLLWIHTDDTPFLWNVTLKVLIQFNIAFCISTFFILCDIYHAGNENITFILDIIESYYDYCNIFQLCFEDINVWLCWGVFLCIWKKGCFD